MKAELLRKFDELLQNDDVMAVRPDVKELRDTWNRLTREEENAQHEQWKTVEHEEGEDFVFTPAPEDERFEALYAAYRERIAEHRSRVDAEQKENLRQKKELLTRLETLIKEEENVGKAFEQFNEINDGWKAVGDVPGDAVRELNDGFQRLRDDFFYNINIYKELREHDLKINLRKKEELIDLARQLTALEDIKEIEMLARSYQKQWSEIGPSPRETWKEVGDTFFGLIREGYGKVQAHYDALRSQQEANLEARRELIRKVNEISALDISNHGTWNRKTEEVLELQKQWKDCGYVPKAEGEEVWKEFRAACDLFFERKNLYYRQRKDEYKGAFAAKERLVKEANELKDETDWKKTTDKILKLQEQWKAAGSAGQSDERRLWGQFRAACDQFFEAKKAFFAGMGDRHDANKQEKEALITDLEGFELTGNRTVDMETLRGYQTRWNSIGHVAKADMQPLSERFFAILDAKWDVLKSNKIERNITNYKSRVDSLRESGSKDLGRERRLLREKIDRLKQRVLQYENNLNFFTGPGADEMKKGVERKIRAANDEIEEIRQKLRLFDEAN
ncbi:MAG: DUF349 domain-containing protein [Flavobacteriales bacterium]